MTSYAEYFKKVTYKPKFFIGDRVIGKYQKLPFIGTVANDFLTDPEIGPKVIVFLDLPLKTKSGVLTMITVKPRDIQKLVAANNNNDAHIPKSSKVRNSKAKE